MRRWGSVSGGGGAEENESRGDDVNARARSAAPPSKAVAILTTGPNLPSLNDLTKKLITIVSRPHICGREGLDPLLGGGNAALRNKYSSKIKRTQQYVNYAVTILNR